MYIFSVNIFGFQLAPSYYGLMYAISFLLGYYIIKRRGLLDNKEMDSLLTYIFLGVILGGRLGYVIFYNFSYFIENIIEILKVWQGGMSFHGGVIGVVIAMALFAKKHKKSFLKLADEVTAILPIGLGFGRIGNYLNEELLGYHPYNGPLAIEINDISYFPSTLVESFLEGFVLLIILNYIYKRKSFPGQVSSLFLIFYSIFRIFVEMFFRMPDTHIGYIFGFLTLGEILSLPMLIIGIYYYNKLRKV